MSISVDDFGAPTAATAATTIGTQDLAHALAAFRRDAATSRVPLPYIRALRYGAPGSSHHLTVNGRPVTIVIARTHCHRANPVREVQSWRELRGTVAAVTCDTVSASLPQELAAAVWEHNGRQICVRRPGTADTVRRGRIRRRLASLSPLPLLGYIVQPFTGPATAVGLLITPVLPPVQPPGLPPAPPEATAETTWPQPHHTWSMPGDLLPSGVVKQPRVLPSEDKDETASVLDTAPIPSATPVCTPTSITTPTTTAVATATPTPVPSGTASPALDEADRTETPAPAESPTAPMTPTATPTDSSTPSPSPSASGPAPAPAVGTPAQQPRRHAFRHHRRHRWHGHHHWHGHHRRGH